MGKKIPMWQCLVVMLAMVGLLVWSIIRDSGGEPHIALILAAVVAGLVAWANGWKWAYLEQGILASINRSMQAILILGILGCLIASWMAAGTIPSMMYYGIKVISPKVFLLTACILCSIVSLATGSSWSTAEMCIRDRCKDRPYKRREDKRRYRRSDHRGEDGGSCRKRPGRYG